MMTKYLVNSGGLSHEPELAKKFYSELLKEFGIKPKFLLCYFAVPREDWDEKYQQGMERIRVALPNGVEPIFDIAFPDTFEKQVVDADAVYISGGDDHLLQYWLRQFDLLKIFQGKTIGTSSASSHALAKHFWTCDWRKCMDGLGLLPIKFLAHYKSAYGQNDARGPIDWDKAYAELEHYGDASLPIHALKEGHFVVIEG